jgi:C-terminal processing protease CtpA/Prc
MKKIFLLLLLIPLVFSCEKVIFEKDLASDDPQTNFDYLWNECNEKYTYFEVKNVDWDQVYADLSPQVSPGITSDSLFRVMGKMLTALRDDHTNLFSPFNISFFGTERLGQDNFDFRLIKENYLPSDFYISGPFVHDFLNNTNEEVGYIRFGSFTGGVSGGNLDFALNRYKDTKGLILDLRENGGGAVRDVFFLLSRFVEQRTLLNYSRLKNGPGHNDFAAAEPVYLDPNPGVQYLKKVVLLVDRGTYSSGSFTALATKAIPNIVLMGDTTGGGLGLPNGGQLPNGWTYRFSVTQALDLNQNPDLENGVPPDVPAFVDWSDLSKDEVIERALLEIL